MKPLLFIHKLLKPSKALYASVLFLTFIFAGSISYAQTGVSGNDSSKTAEDKKAIEKRLKKRDARMKKIALERAEYMGSGEWTVLNIQIVNGDTVFLDNLPPVFKFEKMRGNRNRQSWRQYRRLVYNFKVVYPYALQARAIIQEADSILATNNFTPHERERYISEYQKKLFAEFEKPLRKMTVSQGKLLLKLIDRELGRTSFYIIREYRGRLSAGFWQTVAKLFGNDLKRPYDKFGEDRMVEDLVVIYNAGAYDALYYSMFTQ